MELFEEVLRWCCRRLDTHEVAKGLGLSWGSDKLPDRGFQDTRYDILGRQPRFTVRNADKALFVGAAMWNITSARV